MHKRSFPLIAGVIFLLALESSLSVADEIWFPSRVTNGSFEEWQEPYVPVGWWLSGWASCSPADPFLGKYSVVVANGQPWDGYLYQDIPYRTGTLLFGGAHRTTGWEPNEIILSFLDASMQEISNQRWLSEDSRWQFILTTLQPPDGTCTIRIKLRPFEDGLADLFVDHMFMIPVPGGGM